MKPTLTAQQLAERAGKAVRVTSRQLSNHPEKDEFCTNMLAQIVLRETHLEALCKCAKELRRIIAMGCYDSSDDTYCRYCGNLNWPASLCEHEPTCTFVLAQHALNALRGGE